MDRIGKRFVLYFDDGLKVTRREIILAGEDDSFLVGSDGQHFNKARVVRMEALR